MSDRAIDPDHVVDMFLFLIIGGGFWTAASVYETPLMLVIGAPFMLMFLVSVWRVLQ